MAISYDEYIKKKKKNQNTTANITNLGTSSNQKKVDYSNVDTEKLINEYVAIRDRNKNTTNTNQPKITTGKDENKKWYQQIFSLGEFDEKVDSVGDFAKKTAKTILGTATDVTQDVSKGFMSPVENLLDIGTNIAASGVGLFSDKTANKMRNFADRDLSERASNFVANISPSGVLYNVVSGKPENILDPDANYFEESSLGGYYTDKTSELVGYTLGLIFGGKSLGKTKTLSKGITTKAGTTALGGSLNAGNVGLTIAGKTLNIPTLAVAGGMASGLEEANSKEDVTELERWSKATSSGLIEGITEGITGMFGVGGVTNQAGKEFFDVLGEKGAKLFSSKAGKILASAGIKSLGETSEEFLSYTLNYFADNGIIDKLGKSDFSNEWDWGEVGEQMALAFVSSAIVQGGGSVIETNNAIKEAEKQLGRKLTNEEKATVTQTSIEGTLEEKIGNLQVQVEELEREELGPVEETQQEEITEQVEDIAPTQEVIPPTVAQELTNITNQIDELETMLDTNLTATQQQEILVQIQALEQKYNELVEQYGETQQQAEFRIANNKNTPQQEINLENTEIGPVQAVNSEQISNTTTQETKTNSPVEVVSNTPNVVKSAKVEQNTTDEIAPTTKERRTTNSEVAENLQDDSVLVMTEEEYLSSKGYSFMGYSEAGLHKGSKNESKRSRKQAVDLVQSRAQEYDEKRQELRKEYQAKLESGEIRKPTAIEKSLKVAQGLDERSDVQAARRTLAKRGIDWRTGKPLTESQKQDSKKTPTQEELDNLEYIRKNKSGSEYASAYYDLEKKYGTGLFKGLNNYKSTGKAVDEIAPVQKEIKNLTKEVKNLTKELKEVKKIAEVGKPVTLADLEDFYKQTDSEFRMVEEDIPAPPRNEDTTPDYEYENDNEGSIDKIESPLIAEGRDMDNVGSRKVKAYQYENPEVKPFFQDMARHMMYDLDNSTKGERMIIGDISQTGSGDFEYSGVKRHTTPDIADLLDNHNYTYAEIRKGLQAIIKDHGAENIAVAKRIEFALDDRLRNGYTAVDGLKIPANQEYIDLLNEKSWSDYYSSIPNNDIAPLEEIAPVTENVVETPVNQRIEELKAQLENVQGIFAKGAIQQEIEALEKGFKSVEEYREYQKAEREKQIQESKAEKEQRKYFEPTKVNSININEPIKKGYTRLYRGLESEYSSNYDRNLIDNPNGYESWTDNYELAKSYGENVYSIDIPTNEISNEIFKEDGERNLLYFNDKPVGLNGKSGKEYMLNTNHDNYQNIEYRKINEILEDIGPVENQSLAIEQAPTEFDNGGPMIRVSPEMEVETPTVKENLSVENNIETPTLENTTPEENKNLTVKESNALKLNNLEKSLQKYGQDAQQSLNAFNNLIAGTQNKYNTDAQQMIESYNKDINKKRAEYNSLKNKNTQKANVLLQQMNRLSAQRDKVLNQYKEKLNKEINRLTTQRDNLQVEYERKMNNVQKRIEKMNSKEFKTAEQRMTKQEEYRELARNLMGDTSTWVDKKLGLQYQINTEKRNLRDIVRDINGKADIQRADAINEEYQGKYNENEAKLKVEANQIKEKFINLKLTKQEDVYVQMLGEYKYNPNTTIRKELVDSYYEANKNKIDLDKVNKTIEMARKTYDYLYEQINNALKSQGMKELEYRKGYFPHFTEDKQSMLAKLFNWKVQNDQIPTDIAGLTELNNPERSWQSFNKHRESDITDFSFSKGFDTYTFGALDWKYHIADLQKRRAFENELRYQHSDEGIKEKIEEIYNNPDLDADEVQTQIEAVYSVAKNPLNNFIIDFRNRTNYLAGKKSTTDRTLEYATNRQIYSTVTNLSNRVSGNMIGGSISSALTNFIPITQSWGEVSPLSSLNALKDTIASSVKDDGMVAKSPFLTNRLVKVENLYKSTWDKIGDKVAVMTDVIDNITAQTVWRSKYNENIKNGMSESEAIKNADQFAENVIAGRSRGNEPTIFNSKNPITKMFTSFQLEVNNQYQYMFKDMPIDIGTKSKGKLIKSYATIFLGAYVYNALYSSLVGRDVAFDPIGLIQEILKELGIGDDEEEEKSASEKFTSVSEKIVQQLPFVGGLFGGGRVPISAAIPYDNPIEMFKGTFTDSIDAIFSEKEEEREKALKDLTSEWLKPVTYLALPFGGGQINKTIQGLSMYDSDLPVAGSYTSSGDLRFSADDSFLGKVQAGLFGRWASKSSQEYIDSGFKTIKKDNIEEMLDLDMNSTEYRKYQSGLSKARNKAKEDDTLTELQALYDYIESLDVTSEQKTIMMENQLNSRMSDESEEKLLSLNMTTEEKMEYYDTVNFVSDLESEYKTASEELEKTYGERSDEYEEALETLNKEKRLAIIDRIKNTNLTSEQKAYLYDKYYDSKAIDTITLSGIDFNYFLDYQQNEFKADYNSKGNAIRNSRKNKVIKYVNDYDLSIAEKAILIKSTNTFKFNDYNKEIVDYVDKLEIGYEDKVYILEELDMKINDNGYITWED